MQLAARAAASRVSLSVSDFLTVLFRELTSRHLRYCVLHSYARLPEELTSDLDLAIDPGEMWRLASVWAALQERGYHAIQCLHYGAHGYCFTFSWIADGTPQRAKVDVITENREGKLILGSTDGLLSGRRRLRGFWIPAAAVEFEHVLAKKILKGVLMPRAAARLAELAAEIGPAETRRVCGKLFGAFWGDRAARTSSDGTLMDIVPQLRRRMWTRAVARKPWLPLQYLLTDLPRKFERVMHPTGLLVAVLGVDGAGKSTLIEKIGSALNPDFRSYCVFHWRPGLLAPRADAVVTDPHANPNHGPLRSMIHLGGYIADYWLGFALRLEPLLIHSTLVLFDRYFYDLAADPQRYRYGGPAWLVRLLSRAAPRPDLMLLLDAPPATVLDRKAEMTAEEAEMLRERYRSLERYEFARSIDASKPAAEVASEACETILDAMRTRYSQRHGNSPVARHDSALDQAIGILGSTRTGSEHAGERRFAVLPRAGAARWIVSLDSDTRSRQHLSVYDPWARKGRLLKTILSLAMRLPRRMWARAIATLPSGTLLDELVRDVLGESHANYDVSLGTPGRYRKAGIRIAAGDRVLGFLKIPLTPDAEPRVEHEAAILSRLSLDSNLRPFLPEVLYAGPWDGRFVLLLAPLGSKAGAVRFGNEHRAFLGKLAEVDREPVRAGRLSDAIAREWATVESALEVEDRKIVDAALEETGKYSALTLECGLVHGDFAPWNTRRLGDGVGVFDWEMAATPLPHDWDAFHFETQCASLLGREAGYRVDLRAAHSRSSYLLYLVGSLCRLAAEESGDRRGIAYRLRRLRRVCDAR